MNSEAGNVESVNLHYVKLSFADSHYSKLPFAAVIFQKLHQT